MDARTELDNDLSRQVIGCAMEVHRTLGPGLLEGAYEQALAFELSTSGLQFVRQKPLPVDYKGATLNASYRVDFIIENSLILELKAVDQLMPVHTAQLLSYLRLSGYPFGLLINFNVMRLKDGLKRLIK